MKTSSGAKSLTKTIRGTVATLALPVVLTACALSGTIYGPADEPGEVGYTERQLSENRYRVTFMGDDDATVADVQDYALLRAAQVTVYEDYDYFQVASRSTTPITDSTPTATGAIAYRTPEASQTSCGLLGCQTYRDTTTVVYDERLPRTEESYTTSLEIVMLSSNSNDETVYNAREVINQLQ